MNPLLVTLPWSDHQHEGAPLIVEGKKKFLVLLINWRWNHYVGRLQYKASLQRLTMSPTELNMRCSYWLLCHGPHQCCTIGHVTTSFVLFKKTATGHGSSWQREPASFPLHCAFAVFRAPRANEGQSCGGVVLHRSGEFQPSMLMHKELWGTPPDTRHNKQQIRMRLHTH